MVGKVPAGASATFEDEEIRRVVPAVEYCASMGAAVSVDTRRAGVLAADGSLDRPAMRRRVFADPDARKRLEGIIHPHVRELLHAACARADSPFRGISGIVETADGDLWLNGARGIGFHHISQAQFAHSFKRFRTPRCHH